MKASIKWLEDFVDLSGLTPREVADKLTMSGLEVEELKDRFAYLAQVASAVVKTAEPVSGSDHLKFCQVDAGSFGQFKVICGAPNVREGLVVPLALPGVTLPNGLTVNTTEIRGVTSQGMLCSETELGLGLDASGLMELQTSPGQTMQQISGREEWVMEIGITPNRPDGLSMVGIARDLSALLDRPLKQPEINLKESGTSTETLAQVSVESPAHCLRYVGRAITGVTIGPSPFWLVDRLAAVGQRSVNNVVDITNYVMLEMGLPLHAFDLSTVTDHRIVVKTYPKGTTFTTLDGQNRTLTSEANLMICDGEKPVALAGIMGGLNSEITNDTHDILLEGACFNPTTIRRTARAQGLSTEASYRFERGADPEICGRAVDRAMALIAELAGGEVAKGRLDCYPTPYQAPVVPFSPSRCNAYLGTKHRAADMIKVLTAIGLKVETLEPGLNLGSNLNLDVAIKENSYTAALPPWRPDLTREVDVWEEVARLLDFNNLPSTLPKPPINRQAPPATWTLKNQLREHLVDRGFSESITYSFINSNFTKKLETPENSPWRERILPLLNPMSEEQGIMRPLMTPSLLPPLRLNQGHGCEETAIYEVGAIFLSNGLDTLPEERLTLGALWSGFTGAGTWIEPRRAVDFWDIKGVVEGLAEHLNLSLSFHRSTQTQPTPPWYEQGEAATIELKLKDGSSRPFGHLGRLGKKVARNYGLKETNGPIYLFELDIQLLLDTNELSAHQFSGWGKYPHSIRDLAVVVDRSIDSADILQEIQSDESMPLVGALLFDLYEGNQLPEGKKSLAFRLSFQSQERTLTDKEVNGYFEAITTGLTKRLGATLRT